MTADDVGLAALPLSGPFGQTCAMNLMVYAGGAISLIPRFDAPTVLQAMERDGVTCVTAQPALLRRLADDHRAPVNLTLTTCLSAGTPLPAATQDAFQASFGLPIIELYGMAATSPMVTINPRSALRPGSVGLPLWGIEVGIIAADNTHLPPGGIGEVIVRGHNVMKGYTGGQAATGRSLRNGWLHTGDLGYMDADGYVYIVSRRQNSLGGTPRAQA